MSSSEFLDYYDILQVSTAADQDTIDRVFRHLAQRYHPDNRTTGDSEKFQRVVEAHETLKDKVKRAKYDLAYRNNFAEQAKLVQELTGDYTIESDLRVQNAVIKLLYHKIRGDVGHPGIGIFQIGKMLDYSVDMLEFHIWYLKEKGWIKRLEDGTLGITVSGVDRAIETETRPATNKQVTDQSGQVIRL